MTSYNTQLTWRVTERDGSTYRRTHNTNIHTHSRKDTKGKDKERGQKGVNVRRKREKERRRDGKRDLSERGLIFLWPYTCKLKQFLPSEGQGPLSSSPVPTV